MVSAKLPIDKYSFKFLILAYEVNKLCANHLEKYEVLLGFLGSRSIILPVTK